MRRAIAVMGLVLAAGCGGSSAPTVPNGVTFQVEQTRTDLKGRNIQVQVVNGSSDALTVSRVEFRSRRVDGPSVYRGPATIAEGTTKNLTVEMGRARCGDGIDATVRITYRIDGGDEVTATVRPEDHYGSVGLFMRRDCAESTIGEIAVDPDLVLRGRGRSSVLEIGVTFTPAPTGEPVTLGRVDGTTLLKPPPGSTNAIDHELSAGGPPHRYVLRLIPNRCDVHVVAEDRAGTLLPVHVDSAASGPTTFFLPLDDARRAQIFDFIAGHCRFGVDQDPLLAP